MQKKSGLDNVRLIDLTHTLSASIPSWSGGSGFSHEVKLDYQDCTSSVKFRVQQIKMHAGIGTHIDAPAHCVPDGITIADLPIEKFIVPCVKIDVTAIADDCYSIGLNDIEHFERKYGNITAGSFVAFYTGWEKYWQQPEKYRNDYKFPSIAKETAELLIARDVVGIGIDTLSPDRPTDGFPVHQVILSNDKYIIENIANLSQLPPVGSYIIALPLKTEAGTEAPARLVAMVFNTE